MQTLILLFGLLLCWITVLRPLRRGLATRRMEKFEADLYHFRLKTIRARYRELQEFNYREIEQRYDVDAVYEAMN